MTKVTTATSTIDAAVGQGSKFSKIIESIEEPIVFRIKGWVFASRKTRISNAKEIADLSTSLSLDSTPDMLFGLNFLEGYCENFNFKFRFGTPEVLSELVPSNPSSEFQAKYPWLTKVVKVVHAKEWGSGTAFNEDQTLVKASRYDWTYTTTFTGSIQCSDAKEAKQVFENVSLIDYEALKVPEPILFFTEIILFEDELGDNGISGASVKIRVMDSGFLVLYRFHLRVDHVIYRCFESRLYHKFDESFIYKEVRFYESPASELVEVEKESLLDINQLIPHLKMRVMYCEKIFL